MKKPRKLRNQVIICFCLFGFLLTTFYGTLVFFGINRSEDMLFRNQLQSIVENYLQTVQEGNPDLVPPGLATYVGTGQMPASLFKLVGRYPTGYHEIHIDQGGVEHELQFAIQPLPQSTEQIYFIYDVNGIELSDARQYGLVLLLVLAGILVCCLGVGIGYFLARRIASPLNQLTRKVESFSGKELPTRLTVPGAPDEINFLGQRLEEANERIYRFILREKEFTRNASHELRTPLTVIKGATELLENRLSAGQSSTPRSLQRIKRSLQEMELMIDTFLMLAREDEVPPPQKIDLGRLCAEVAEDTRLLIVDPDVSVGVQCDNPVIVYAPRQVTRIVVSNLLRNAVQHSFGKDIVVEIKDNSLTVKDDGCGISEGVQEKVLQPGVSQPGSGGTGFGLTIVHRICNRLGWQLKIRSAVDAGTEVSVMFVEMTR